MRARSAQLRQVKVGGSTARGGIVEGTALASSRRAGAGLDVFAEEAPEPGSPLRGLANARPSPYLAGLDLAFERVLAERCVAGIPAALGGRDRSHGLSLDPTVLELSRAEARRRSQARLVMTVASGRRATSGKSRVPRPGPSSGWMKPCSMRGKSVTSSLYQPV